MTISAINEKAAWIELQGAKVLDVLEQDDDSITYQVLGFEKPKLLVIDYRKKVKQTFERCLIEDDFSRFPYSFSSPANIILQQNESGDLLLSLSETLEQIPEHMVWIIVGFEGEYPVYDFIFQEVQKNKDNVYSGITIYPLDALTMKEFMKVDASNISVNS
jgi:hypothetical protein